MILRQLDVRHLLSQDPPPIPWVAEGVLAKGELTILTGSEGEGKSLLVSVLAAGVLGDCVEAGIPCRRGCVLLIDAENGAREIHRRVRALALPAEGLSLYEAERLDLLDDYGDLSALVEREKPDLLVLDSFRSLWSGDENDSRAVAAALDNLHRITRMHEPATCLLHHSPKAGGGYRGSTAIGASADLGFVLARAPRDPDSSRRQLTCWKCRIAPKPPPRWIRVNMERGQVSVDLAEPFISSPKIGTTKRDLLAQQLLGVLDEVPRSLAEVAKRVGRSRTDGSVRRVLVRLEDDGAAQRVAGGWRKGPEGGAIEAARVPGATGATPYGGVAPGTGAPGPVDPALEPDEEQATADEEAEYERASEKSRRWEAG